MPPPGTPPALLPFDPDTNAIPLFLRQQKRWAPWKGIWNAKRQKWDKIPLNAHNPARRMSTAAPDNWFSYEDAIAALRRNPTEYSGIGFVMTGMKGLVGIDGDKCVEPTSKEPNEFAKGIVAKVSSYSEFSPSGAGIRTFTFGEVPQDFTNHKAGLEVYQGDHPRFLTVTGRHIEGTPADVVQAAPGSLEEIVATYRTGLKSDGGEKEPRPLLLPPAEVPTLDSLELPYYAREFFTQGPTVNEDGTSKDGSDELRKATFALFKAGLTDVQVQSFLVSNQHAYELALAHREQKQDKAEKYLWDCHAKRIRDELAKSNGLLRLEDFDNLSVDDEDGTVVEQTAAPEADGAEFSAVTEEQLAELPKAATKTKEPKARRKYSSASEVAKRPPMKWLIHGVLPKGEVACLFGPSGSGKSFVAFSMAHALALGVDWWGRKVHQRQRVLYVALEGSAGLGQRVEAHQRFHGVEYDDRLTVAEGSLNLLDKDDVRAFVKELKAERRKFEVIWLDTLAQATPGANENSSEDMGRALAHTKLIAEATGAMVILIAHTGKDVSKGSRGWSGQKGAMDAELEVTREKGKPRTLHCSKQKDAADDFGIPFDLEVLALGHDSYGDPISSCVAVPLATGTTTVPTPPKWAKGANELVVQRAVEAILTATPGKPILLSHLLEKATDLREEVLTSEGKEVKRKAIKDGMRDAIGTLKERDKLVDNGKGLLTVRGLEFTPAPTLEFPNLTVEDDGEDLL